MQTHTANFLRLNQIHFPPTVTSKSEKLRFKFEYRRPGQTSSLHYSILRPHHLGEAVQYSHLRSSAGGENTLLCVLLYLIGHSVQTPASALTQSENHIQWLIFWNKKGGLSGGHIVCVCV